MITKAQFKRAIEREEFRVVYQPIVVLADGRCAGAEVLVRWQREDGALLPPDRFLAAAQRHGYLNAITDRVLQQTVSDLAPTLRAHRSLHAAVNIPAQDVNSGRILEVLDAALNGTGIVPAQLWLEITESSSMETLPSRETLSRARERGHLIALDDFGTGYSCLRYLHELPCDVLKLDRSFVIGIGTDHEHPVLACIIDLARKLKLKIVAEGVETPVQARYLEQACVDYAQGWHYARPMLAAEFARYCDRAASPAGSPLSPLSLHAAESPLSSLAAGGSAEAVVAPDLQSSH